MTKKYKNMGGSGGHSSCTPSFSKIVIAGKPIKDFPAQGKFQTATELDSYFADDKLQCLECGLQFKQLGRHLLAAHNMGRVDYNEKYGIPKYKGLVPDWWKEEASLRKKKQFAENPEYLKAAMKNLADNLYTRREGKRVATVHPAMKDRMAKNLQDISKRVETKCLDCSVKIRKRLQTVEKGQARCEKCYSEYRLKSKKEWYYRSVK